MADWIKSNGPFVFGLSFLIWMIDYHVDPQPFDAADMVPVILCVTVFVVTVKGLWIWVSRSAKESAK